MVALRSLGWDWPDAGRFVTSEGVCINLGSTSPEAAKKAFIEAMRAVTLRRAEQGLDDSLAANDWQRGCSLRACEVLLRSRAKRALTDRQRKVLLRFIGGSILTPHVLMKWGGVPHAGGRTCMQVLRG